ncbi:hypothetical protein CC86DRAFT_401578 [Ophiobolus disseminans]|uniref:Uncharacterized protein n=1 Tax=Ophiobolus disseminans TaxID=1469910 RepID=A0A6A7AED3_9PLEO|nr:hypothetical protein CC86DRAFT_401578 [Ophiobolus disseminans]
MAGQPLTLTQQWAALANHTADDITKRNQQQSPLLRLPGEARNKIYAYYFDSLVIDVCEPTSGRRKYSTCTYDGSGRCLLNYGANACGMMRACRQLNADCRALLFQYATLRIEYADGLSHFLNDLSAVQLEGIRAVFIPFVFAGSTSNDYQVAFDHEEYTRDKSRFILRVRAIARVGC